MVDVYLMFTWRCRGAKVLENRIAADEERIKLLEKELEMTIVFGEEADRKYEEVSRRNKFAIGRVDISRGTARRARRSRNVNAVA